MCLQSLSKQRGHASILFVLTVPVLLGLFSLATDGARMVQNQARMEDALEAASLAVAALNDPNDDDNDGVDDGAGDGGGSAANQALVRAYLDEYMVGMNSIEDVKIVKVTCENAGDCSGDDGGHRYFEYRVSAVTEHSTWFSSTLDSGETEYDVSADSISQKFQNNSVDIVFVSDFSGSMGDPWSGSSGGSAKYVDLAGVISSVTDELGRYNQFQNVDLNTAGYVGFNTRSAEKYDEKDIYLETIQERRCILFFCWYEDVEVEVEVNPGESSSGTFLRTEITLRTYDHLLPDEDNYSPSSTVSSLFTSKNHESEVVIALDESGDIIVDESDAEYLFYDVPLTSDFTHLNSEVARFIPDGYTRSYQGLIRGAQLAAQGDNPRRLIIVLSDGKDRPASYINVTSALVTQGMCSTIRNTLDAQTTTGGDEVSSKIAVIGFDYDVSENTALQSCAGAENVYQAQNTQEILNVILELIVEEIGHLK